MMKAAQLLAAAVLAVPIAIGFTTAGEASGHRGYGNSYAHGKQVFRVPSHFKRAPYWGGRKFYGDSRKHRFSRFGTYRNNRYLHR